MDKDRIAAGKKMARIYDKSVSQLVSDYFYLLEQQKLAQQRREQGLQEVQDVKSDPEIDSVVRSLIGIIPNASTLSDEQVKEEYYGYLEKKYL